ncbi:dihydroorotase [Deferribacterales bacterium RsTz2092]|nr:dihydroorotase [Deferribacterales bacterium]
MTLLIKNGLLVDPSQKLHDTCDILLKNGVVAEIGKDIKAADAQLIDATGQIVLPGIIDMHTHLREPGLEAKEDIASGTRAAAMGGITRIACMANTYPVVDKAIIVRGLKEQITKTALVHVEVIGAVTKGLEGKELAEMGDMAFAGAIAFSDDGHYVSDSRIFRAALEYASTFDKIIIVHDEDNTLTSGGYMHEGAVSTRLGIPGLPSVSEDIAVSRDTLLAEYSNARLHVAHVASAGALEIIRQAKKRGVKVTAEATIHHLTLTDNAVEGYNTAAKIAPPLRDIAHRDALRAALKDGTIDIIVTDHSPHAFEEKDVEFRYAPNGFAGLETSVGVIFTDLYHTGVLSIDEIVEKMSCAPARLFNIDAGSLKLGKPADVTIINPNAEWAVESSTFCTKGKATPFEGKHCKGKATWTIVAGRVVMSNGRLNE